MKPILCQMVAAILLISSGCAHNQSASPSVKNDFKFLSVNGQTTAGDVTSFWVSLVPDGQTWQAGEIGGTSKVFTIKSGVYIYSPLPDDATLLKDSNGNIVAQLTSLHPGISIPGATGAFKEFETAQVGTWSLMSSANSRPDGQR